MIWRELAREQQQFKHTAQENDNLTRGITHELCPRQYRLLRMQQPCLWCTEPSTFVLGSVIPQETHCSKKWLVVCRTENLLRFISRKTNQYKINSMFLMGIHATHLQLHAENSLWIIYNGAELNSCSRQQPTADHMGLKVPVLQCTISCIVTGIYYMWSLDRPHSSAIATLLFYIASPFDTEPISPS